MKRHSIVIAALIISVSLALLTTCGVRPSRTQPPARPTTVASQPPPTVAELNLLQGYWEGEGAGGKCSITITGNSLHYRVGTNWFETTFILPAGTDPRQLHATIRDSSPPTNNTVGKVVYAIYKFEDGTLTFAENDMSDKPPKSFPDASSHYSVKRVQPQGSNAEASISK